MLQGYMRTISCETEFQTLKTREFPVEHQTKNVSASFGKFDEKWKQIIMNPAVKSKE